MVAGQMCRKIKLLYGGHDLTLHPLQQLLVLAGFLGTELQTLGRNVEDGAVLLLRYLVCLTQPERKEKTFVPFVKS